MTRKNGNTSGIGGLFDERILLIAPHPDDEILGAGSLLLKRKSLFLKTHIVFTTNGVPLNDKYSNEKYCLRKKRRLVQLEEVSNDLGFSYELFDIPSRSIISHYDDLGSFIKIKRNFNTVLIPSMEQGHPDHDLVSFICYHIFSKCRIVFYNLYKWNLYGVYRDYKESIISDENDFTKKLSISKIYKEEYDKIISKLITNYDSYEMNTKCVSKQVTEFGYNKMWELWFDYPSESEYKNIINKITI